MRHLAFLLAVTVAGVVTVGCSAPPSPEAPAGPQSALTTEVQLEHDGLERSFRVTVPADAGDKELPMLVALHGAGGSAVTLSYLTGFDLAVPDARFVLVEPNGTGPDSGTRTWNAGTCCGSSVGTVDDVGFLAAILDRVAADFPVDADRVYLAGFSNGGMLAYRAACELGERVAGIAVVAGTMNVEGCPAAAPVPVLAVHGDGDTVVPFAGGESSYGDPRVEPWYNLPVEEAVGFWAERNGCPSEPEESTVGAARVIEWDGCSVELWVVQGGRHTWFGGPMSAGSGLEPDGAPSATDLVLDFFGLTA
ncbi:alpha/beta hydrolase family esterase [Lysobacter korlensis]|uniref:Alpha/beta hydrolase family esterase n=1 Tax=Lysobacter korlensis TaxID=553636 RepID=A0ABV6RYQ8_9GAMM